VRRIRDEINRPRSAMRTSPKALEAQGRPGRIYTRSEAVAAEQNIRAAIVFEGRHCSFQRTRNIRAAAADRCA
jgi:hypothetical protein